MKITAKAKALGAGVLAVLLATIMILTLLPGKALAAGLRTSDLTTETRFHESLGHDASTEYAGRIWTDKSVYSDDAVIHLMSGQNATIDNDADFLVSFSALATSQSVTGSSHAPVDVVFVIDTSGSMDDSMSSTDSSNRMRNTIDALNDSIETILSLNEYTRIGVVAFARTSQVLLPLGRYEKGSRGNVTDYFSINNGNDTIYIHATNTATRQEIESTRSVTGGTNIQRGIYEGMNMLATEASVSANVNGSAVQRVPSLVLLSDGAPTYSVANSGNFGNTTRWWNPANNYSDGDGNTPYYGNGMKALMTGAYMKEAVNRNYGVAGTKMEMTVYTIGMGINGLDNTQSYFDYGSWEWVEEYYGQKDLAQLTLAPYLYWDENNAMASSVRSAWNTYVTNDGTPSVATASGESYTLTHPSQYDIDTDPDALKNLVKGYYDADSASGVADVFRQVVSSISISAPEVPTEMEHTDAMTTGYITYTDPLGQYMELKNVKGIIYKGVVYDNVTKNADGSWTVSQNVETDLYGERNLSGVVIRTSVVNGLNTVTVQIPAALIPVRINTVELNADGSVKSHTNNGSFPMRVIYSVGLQDGLVAGTGKDAYVLTETLSQDYLQKNTVDGKIQFYSNFYDGTHTVNGHTAGNATVEFEPAHSNPFYYMQGDDAIYRKDGNSYVKIPATETLHDDGTYYYKTEFYEGTSVVTKYIERSGAQLKKVEIIVGADGYLHREKGSPRLNRILEFEGTKTENATGTAQDFYAPTFVHADGNPDPAAGKYVIYLGNNGVLSMAGDGALEIRKNTVIPAGLAPSVTDFEFTVDFNGNSVLAGNFNYTIVETGATGTVSDGGNITLKNGQTARITGLPVGTTYTVTEKDYSADGFTTAKTGDSGTIAAGETDRAVFTNTYAVSSVQYPGATGLSGKKILQGRAWENGTDSYTFFLTPYFSAPLPAGYDADRGVTVTSAQKIDADSYEAAFTFGSITFDAPGVYRYTIYEKTPAADDFLPGVTYSRALYRVVVTVTDNGRGKLIASPDVQKLYTDDADPLFTYDAVGEIVLNQGQEAQDEVVFTNRYAADSVTRVPVANKHYVDESGATKLVSGMFRFRLEALGYCVGEYNAATFVSDKAIPMPEGAVNGVSETSNEGTNVTFPHVTFTHADLKGENKITYRYRMSEIAGTTKGLTYDSAEYLIDVTVSASSASSVLSVTARYMNASGQEVRIADFTNLFDPDDATLTKSAGTAIHGTKILLGRPFAAGETFRFTLTAQNDAAKAILPAPETVATEVAAGQSTTTFTFSDMTFDKVGTYLFTVEEIAGADGIGIDYDSELATVTVTVTLNEATGAMEAAVNYDKTEFRNIYTATFKGTPVTLEGKKSLTGKTLVAGEFYFLVEELDEAGRVIDSYLVTHLGDDNSDGVAFFTVLENQIYTKAGKYTYRITEQIPAPPVGGTTYDRDVYHFEVTVTDDGLGGLSATTALTVQENGTGAFAPAGEILFENAYKPNPLVSTMPVVKKLLRGDRAYGPAANEFEFELKVLEASPADGIILPAITKVRNAADGSVSFGDLTFTKAGHYTIAVSEVVDPAWDEDPAKPGVQKNGVTYSTQVITATVEVLDDRNGNLTVNVLENVGGDTITNTYDTLGKAQLTIVKELENRPWNDTDKFEFEVVIEDPDTLEAMEHGWIEFPHNNDGIYKLTADKDHQTIVSPEILFRRSGTFKFLVHEIDGGIPGILYDEDRHEVTVTCVDNGDGTQTVNTNLPANTLVFTNTYSDKETELSGHANLSVTKNFVGRADDAWYATDAFVFTLEGADEVTRNAITAGEIVLPANASSLVITAANKAHAHFGNILFKKANADGEAYRFVVKELTTATEIESATSSAYTAISGVKYDADPTREISVRVTSDGMGLLSAAVVSGDPLTFTNTYTVNRITLNAHKDLVVKKVLTGRDWLDTDSFAFILEPMKGTSDAIAAGKVILPTSVTSATVVKADVNHQDSFGDDANPDDGITFLEAGVYSFVVSEKPGSIANLTYDTHETIVTVTVEDDGLGNLLVAAVTFNGSMTFENVYTPTPVTQVIEGKKTLLDKTLRDGDFSFRLVAQDGAPVPAKTETSNVGETISFGTVTFTKAGVYQYTVTEIEPAEKIAGVAYDQGSVTVTVTVTYDSATGKLSASTAYAKTGEGTGFEFVNRYKASPTAPITLGATKTVLPSAGNAYTLKDGDFNFTLTPATTNPVPDPISGKTVSNKADGSVLFAENVVFTQAGTWIYTVNEESDGKAGFLYDDAVYTVTVTVTDQKDQGKLTASVSVLKDGSPVSAGIAGIAFENGYHPTKTSTVISGKKVLQSEHKDLERGEFTFVITPAAGAPAPATLTAVNEASGVFSFGSIEFAAPGVYVYTVTEKNEGKTGYTYDSASYTVTVTVRDVAGQLKAEVVGVKDANDDPVIVFTNSYSPVPTTVEISGTKKIVTPDGKESDRKVGDQEFTFKLYDENGKEIGSVKNGADGSFTFRNVSFQKKGDYTLTVREASSGIVGITDDSSTFSVKVKVEDVAGQLKASVSYPETVEFKNVYQARPTSVQLSGIKKITGRDLVDGEFTFQLLNAEGKVISTAKNTKDGAILFDAITYLEAGTYKYKMIEVKGDAKYVTYDETVHEITVTVVDPLTGTLSATISGNGASVVFENAYKAPDPVVPATSDNGKPELWISLAVISALLILAPVVLKKRRQN